jgi:hypothetical protein
MHQGIEFRFPCPSSRLYRDLPEIYDGLSFIIPCTKPLKQRMIEMEGVLYEVWSPNSTTSDFYPGALREDEPPEAHKILDYYPDGRHGPKDFSFHPQHFRQEKPWLGFCRYGVLDDCDWHTVSPEVVPLPLVWISSPHDPHMGRIHEEYRAALVQRDKYLEQAIAKVRQAVHSSPWVNELLQNAPSYPMYLVLE